MKKPKTEVITIRIPEEKKKFLYRILATMNITTIRGVLRLYQIPGRTTIAESFRIPYDYSVKHSLPVPEEWRERLYMPLSKEQLKEIDSSIDRIIENSSIEDWASFYLRYFGAYRCLCAFTIATGKDSMKARFEAEEEDIEKWSQFKEEELWRS